MLSLARDDCDDVGAVSDADPRDERERVHACLGGHFPTSRRREHQR